MKNLYKIVLFVSVLGSMTSCGDSNDRNYQYMPNMYESVPYDTYGEYDVFPDGYEALKPAENSVMRGWLPYDYENTNEGYASAKANLENPLAYTEGHLATGKELYTIYCAICHGNKGDGKGTLATREKILGVPAYNDEGRAITEGSVYHVMYYGINTMGSYASQMTEEELWMVDHYVMNLKMVLNGEPMPSFDVEEVRPDLETAVEPNPENAATVYPQEENLESIEQTNR